MTHSVKLRPPHAGLPASVTVGPEADSGGEGAVYFSTDGGHAVKVFHRSSPELDQHLRHVMTLFANLPQDQQHFIVPPLALIDSFDGEPQAGFVMRRVPPRYRKAVDFILTQRQAFTQFRRGLTWASYLLLARSIAHAIVVLHNKGCAHTDIHYNNFLVDIDEGDAVMMEADGVVVAGGFVRPRVKGLSGFIAPEILTDRVPASKSTDRHSLAVLMLHTLLFRNPLQPLIEYSDEKEESERLGWGAQALFSEHPTNYRHRPACVGLPAYDSRGVLSYRMLSPQLQRLTEAALITGLHDPAQRPSIHNWLEALAVTLDQLWSCVRCRQRFPYPFWIAPAKARECPFCGQRCPPPLPVVVALWEERQPGMFAPIDRRLVLGDQFPIFVDIAQPHRHPPRTRRGVPTVGHVVWDPTRRGYRLVNDSDHAWTGQHGNGQRISAGRGQSLPLYPKTMIRLGADHRVMEVVDPGG